MTDKQIIIDGINVSDCPHFIDDYQWWNIAGREEHDLNRCSLSFDDHADFEENDFCKENPNCYYKQLKRAENQIVDLNKMVEAKEQECEAYKMEAEEGYEINTELKAENEKLKQTLAEIKEIAEQIENNDLYVTVPAKVRIGDKIKINLIGIQDILNIINEEENDRT